MDVDVDVDVLLQGVVIGVTSGVLLAIFSVGNATAFPEDTGWATGPESDRRLHQVPETGTQSDGYA